MKLRQYHIEILILASISGFATKAQEILLVNNKPVSTYEHLVYESNEGDSVVRLAGYAAIFSFTQRLPLYTFHKLSKDQLEASSRRVVAKRSTSFRPWRFSNTRLSATNGDYAKSGFDRGHMVPAGDFVWNQTLKDETFFHINVNPQMPNLNRGIWAFLENEIRKFVLATGQDVLVVTGVVFTKESNRYYIGPNRLQVPSVFFKMLYFPNTSNAYAFMFDNTIQHFEGNLSDFQVTVDFIEYITGEDFFDLMDDEKEKVFESHILPFGVNIR